LRRLAKSRRKEGIFFQVMEIVAKCATKYRPPLVNEAKLLLQASE